MIRYGFLILHYGSAELTVACINSIMGLPESNKLICVIDNASNTLVGGGWDKAVNDCGDKLKVITSSKNLGFARGNNIGFSYLKSQNCDFILMINNDVVFNQNSILLRLELEYRTHQFAVCGPLICTPDYPQGGYDNPGRMENYSISEVDHIIRSYKYQYFLKLINLFDALMKITHKTGKLDEYMESKDNSKPCKNTILNGCALFFSPLYIEKFNGLDSRTFMYAEEFILYEHVIKNNLSTYFCPNLTVFHNCSKATSDLFRKKKKKELWQLKNSINSMRVLKKVIKEYDNELYGKNDSN